MEKISIPWKTVKGTWNSSLLEKINSFGKMKVEVAWKMAEGSGTKGFPVSSAGKESTSNEGDRVQSPGWEDPLEKETAPHSSTPA